MAVAIGEREENIFLDIYDFGYLDFEFLWRKYWDEIDNEKIARSTVNRKMRKLTEEGYIYPIPYKSIKNGSVVGRIGYVYTLAGKGVGYVKRLYGDKEVTWDPNKKYRKGEYIEHHLQLAHFSIQAMRSIPRQYEMQYRGEKDAAFRIENGTSFKNIILPDALWFIRNKATSEFTPIFVEYERTVRRSEKKMHEKVNGQNSYFKNGFYKEHDVLKSFPAEVPPVLIYISNDNRTNFSYQRLIGKNYRTWYEKGNYCSELLFTTIEQYLTDPFGDIFVNLNNQRKSLKQITNLASWSHTLSAGNVKWLPSYMTASKLFGENYLFTDGILLKQIDSMFSEAKLVFYVKNKNLEYLNELAANIKKYGLRKHSLLSASFSESSPTLNPSLVFLMEEDDEIESLSLFLRSLDFGGDVGRILVGAVNEIIGQPGKPNYYDVKNHEKAYLWKE
ncbi:hypothetical protein NSQ59_27355 [Margalitia sp. FSL K6-0131]|uniref:hypothetical protein n=1 Tax=Margalitia sp. FSL K6-0131 TaxID=2954604 RepID=UPI0030F53D8A